VLPLHPAGAQVRADQIAEAIGLDPATYDRRTVADSVGLPTDETVQWWRAMGIVEVPDGVVAFGDADMEMARVLADLLSADAQHRDDVMRLARLLGGSFSRIAEAQVRVLEEVLGAQGLDTPAQRADALLSLEGRGLLAVFQQSVLYVWRRHLFATLGRWVGAEEDQAVQAVGFADISGFSALSKRITTEDLAEIVEAFERESVDVVTHNDGRVVKFIGDEVLFVVDSVGTAVDVALELSERMAASAIPVQLHCGIAHGPTITIGGDVFGNTVNLAKRLTAAARRNKVVLTKATATTALADRDDLEQHRVARVFELKGIGRTQLVSVSRRGDDGGARRRRSRSRGEDALDEAPGEPLATGEEGADEDDGIEDAVTPG
jgi:adenylate cyclase